MRYIIKLIHRWNCFIVKPMIHCHYIFRNVPSHLLHSRESNMFPKVFWHPLVPLSLPLLFAIRCRLLCRVLYFAPAHRRGSRVWYSDARDLCNAEILYAEEKLSTRRITPINIRYTPRVINDFALFIGSACKGRMQKTLTFKYRANANDDVHIPIYTRCPRSEVISICFIIIIITSH